MSAIYVFLYQNLNVKVETAIPENVTIYVFLYQNLNDPNMEITITVPVDLCISILEKKYRRKGLKNKDLMLLYNKRINKKLKGLTLVFYIS